jgi:GNAT superfamily N-acetyltransferase
MPDAPPRDIRLVAKTGSGELAGFIGVIGGGGGGVLHINALEVKPEFRGLGIGEELCSRLLNGLNPHEAAYITVDLPAGSEGFSPVLLRQGFTPFAVRYYKSMTASPDAGYSQNRGDEQYVKPQSGNQ